MDERYSEEIQRLYLQMYSRLFEYARSSFSSNAMAEEAVQDTFTIACRKADAVFNSPNPEGWIFNTLKNVIANTLRSQYTAMRILESAIAMDAEINSVTHDQADLDILYGDLSGMEEFKLMKEMALDGRSHLEMAEARGITVEACRKRVERAKKILRKKIKF